MEKVKTKKEATKGITLMALIVTIVILLILAGITIGALTGENGLIQSAGKAKERAEIDSEKEAIEISVAQAMGKNKYGNLEETKLEKELENYNATVTTLGENFIVECESGRKYIVNKDGNVEEKDGVLASDLVNETDKTEIYGAYVTNYMDIDIVEGEVADGINEQKSDWQIYYAGKVVDETEEHIYLIASNYLKYDSIPVSKNGIALDKATDSLYAVYFKEILNDYIDGSEAVKEETKYLNKQYFDYLEAQSSPNNMKANSNMRAVAYMCDTSENIWGKFTTTNAEFAIGGPTVELLLKSYNQKYGTNYTAGYMTIDSEGNTVVEKGVDSNGNEVDTITKNGYRLRNKSGIWNNNLLDLIATSSDTTYFLPNNSCWIASPAGNATNALENVRSNGYIIGDYCDWENRSSGFRPIVCLKSSVQLIKNEDGTYAIK